MASFITPFRWKDFGIGAHEGRARRWNFRVDLSYFEGESEFTEDAD